ncbi:FUSC family protein [Nocardioides sp. JQ2195]|nr:FUSC family protein [Nocardioides sp. JQ2195]
MGPHNGAHRVAFRAGVSVAVPLLLLLALDRVDWSIYAAFGAFTSLYGRNHVGLSRTQMQVTLGVLLTGSVGLGAWVATSHERAWLAVPVAGLVAAIGSWFSEVQDWHPPGTLFLIFGFAAVASIPADVGDIPVALAVAAGSATFSVLVGSLGAAWRHVRAGHPRRQTGRRRIVWSATARRHIARNVAGVLVAGGLATAMGVGHPYWAMVSAVVPLTVRDLLPQVVRGVQRVVGTALGLVLAAVLLSLDLPSLALILLVVLLQVGAELLVGRNYALALIVITPLALLMVHIVAPTPTGTLLLDRGVETLVGAVIGVLIGYLTRDRRRA